MNAVWTQNAPKTLQRTVDVVLTRVNCSLLWLFREFRNIFVKARELIEHVRQVLTILNDEGLPFCLKKGDIVTNLIDYLAHVIPPGRLEVTTQISEAVADSNILST